MKKGARYETISHTADVMIRAFGSTLEETFENAAYGLFDQMADLSNVEPKQQFKMDIEGTEPQQLLVDFLSELLYLFDTELVLLNEFKATYDGEMLKVIAKGEKIDKKRHTLRKSIKAVSYHMIEVAPEKGYVQVLFDA
jgi:SHS2 domain-containing protein